MIDLLAYMKREWEQVSKFKIKIVSFPLPPTPVQGKIYMPSAFNSRTFEVRFDRPKQFNAVMAKPSKWGPAILVYINLDELIKFSKKGLLTVPHSTICAGVSSYPLFTGDDGLIYLTDVVLDDVRMSHRSCHPGSHYSAPKAPYLTALLQYAQAPHVKKDTRDDKRTLIEYASPEEAEKIFPACDFTSNRWIDNFLGTCAVNPKVSYFKLTSGPGSWARDYLKDLRHNILLKEHEREQKKQGRTSLLGDAGQENGRKSHKQRDLRNQLSGQVPG